MKKITLWLFALFTCWQISAQTTVTIGAGTSDSGTGTNASPVYRSSAGSAFNFSQSMELLTASDLTAAGITSGSTITKIAYYKTNAFTMSAGRSATVNIYMKNSAATSFGATTPFSTYIAGATQCYSNAVVTATEIPGAAGWVEFTFSTPFNYTGGSIEVGINWAINAGAGNPTTGGFAWQYTTVAGNQAAGTSDSVAITGNLTSTATRLYNTQLTYTNSPCSGVPAPGNTIAPATICAGASANLTLQNSTIGSGVTYQWYNSGGAIVGATNPTYLIPSVVSSDTYHCDVTCGASTTSSSNLVVGPSANPTLPWSENFDALPLGNDIFPSCWGFQNTSSNWSITTSPTAYSGANSLRRSWSTDGWAFTPLVTLTAGVSYRFSYYVRTADATVGYDNTVAVGNGQNAAAMATTLFTETGFQNIAWTKVNNEFTPTVSGDYSFGLHVVAPVSPNGINFDDFKIELSPTCPDQTGLVVGNITASGADTSWDDMSVTGALGYEYAITTSATPPASGTATTSTFYIASGLLPQTVYYLHVRSTCTGSTYGNWATVSFTTACAPITALPYLEPFATFLPNQCWLLGDNGDLTAGPATFGTNGWFADGFANIGSTGSFSYNIWLASANDWVISPQFTIPTTGYELKFDAAATNYGTTTAVTNWESDDVVEVLVSTTGTSNWTVLYTYNNSNVPSNTGASNSIDLSAYTGQTVRFAYRAVEGATDGAADLQFFIDNFQVRLSPTCPDQTGLVVGNITSTGADTSWDDMSVTGALGYEYAITTSATPPASGTATTNTFYIASGLLPQTVYYLHVRSTCASSTFGNWSTVSFTTGCASITTLPWIQNFDTVTVPAIPQCWSEENGDYQTSSDTGFNTPRSGANYLRDAWSATNEFMWTPAFDLVAGTSYDFSSWIQGDGDTSWTVDFYVNTTQNSAGATQLGVQYVVPGSGTIAIQPYAQVTRSFVPATSGTYYFAFRVNEPTGGPWYVAFDDVELKLSPSTPPGCTTNLVATPNATCGNFSNNLTWDAEPTATGYYITIGTTTGGTDIANALNIGSNVYSFTGTIATTYFWKVVPYNAAGSATGCAEQSFTTVATGCYCAAVPTSNDNSGITSATIGATTNAIADVTYVDLTAVPEVIVPGANTNVQLTFSTGYIYDINIWIDFNNDFDFNDAGELVQTGIACTAAQPNIVDASFVMPLSAPSGIHRMRISSADSGQTIPDPCYNGDYGVTLDFTVDTTLSSNSFDKSTFAAYPNPVKDVLNLSYKTAISNVKVINLLGQEVLNTKTNGNDVQVNMSALNAGAYIVNITVEDMVHTIKVIKQ